jgi:DNA-binding beta-propeller fold protein YncE
MQLITIAAALLLAAQPLPHSSDLYVSGFFDSSVQRFFGPRSVAPGAPNGTYARPVARRPWGLAFGPDGNLWVANQQGSPGIVRVSGPFTATPGVAEVVVDGGAFYDLAFGPDGNLYAAGAGPVRRYDVVTHELIDEFTHGYTLAQTRGIAFGPDGNLYVSNYDSCVSGPAGCSGSKGEIVRFDGVTGDFLGIYIASGQGGLRAPWKIAFNARGELFVANWESGNGNILRYPESRAHRAEFIARDGFQPVYLAIGPDQNLYVSNSDSSGASGSVLRFDGRTGALIDVFVPSVNGGPRGLAFAPGSR